MGALNKTTTEWEWGTIDLCDSQKVEPSYNSNNIYDGVKCSDLVKMDLIHRFPMDSCLSFSKSLKYI